jgi:hypothetical protein
LKELSNIKTSSYPSNYTKAMKLNISKNEIATITGIPFSKMHSGILPNTL